MAVKFSPVFSLRTITAERFFFYLAVAVPFLLIVGRASAEIAMALTSLYFLYTSWRTKDWSWTKITWVRLVGVTWLYLILSAVMADFDVESALKRGAGWIRFPLFAIAFVTLYLPYEKNRIVIRNTLGVLLALVSIDTIAQFLTGTSLTGNPLPANEGRLGGPFGVDMVVGIYLSRLLWIALGMTFAWCVIPPAGLKRFAIPVALTALVGVTIILSGERAALGLFGFTAILFWVFAKRLRIPLLTVAVIGALGAGSLLWFNPTLHTRFIDRTVETVSKGGDSSYGRVWHNAMTAFKLSPVFGVGPHNYLSACEELREPGGFVKEAVYKEEFNCARHPHNPYVEWLTETGVIGFALFLGLVGVWVRNGWQNLKAAPEKDYFAALGFFVALLPFLWPLMSSMSFFSNWSAILFWWVMGFSQTKQKI